MAATKPTHAQHALPDGWRRVRLGDHLALCRNGLVSRQDANPDEAVPVTRIETIADGKIDWTRVGYVPLEEVDQGYLVRNGDILLSHINSVKHIGKVARMSGDGPLLHGMNLMLLRFSVSLEPEFGYALMSSASTKLFMERRAKKAVNQASINRQDIFELPILLPPLPEQRAIAAVLESIDDAIEGAEAVIAATEGLRDALLHDLLTRGLRGQHTEFRDVPGLGTIPADWEVVRLGDVYEVQLGKMLSPKAKKGVNPKPYLTNRNVRWGGFELSDLPMMDFDQREMEKFHLQTGDLMVCEGGETGRAAVWEGEIVDCYYQKALHRLRPKRNNAVSKFMLAVLMLFGKRNVLLEHSEQTSISHLTRERLLRMPIFNPPLAEQQAIVAALDGLDAALEVAREEGARLRLLKESTADALLTGRERLVE